MICLAHLPIHRCSTWLPDPPIHRCSTGHGPSSSSASQAQKTALPTLASAPSAHVAPVEVSPGQSLCIIPRPWLESWRAYVTAPASKRGANAPERPGPLKDALEGLFCKHKRLIVPLPAVSNQRGRWVVTQAMRADSPTELTVVPAAAWDVLAGFYPPSGAPVRAWLEAEAEGEPEGGEESGSTLIKEEEHTPSRPKATGQLVSEPPLCPQVCPQRWADAPLLFSQSHSHSLFLPLSLSHFHPFALYDRSARRR